ncbi:IclR family transcriptional regulator [uncultured Amnibacterium sp.]|uniref:IclR family transcriptional regulator n=1 Tax=uncultured Amnibacterium sp. TaxID=1631851 RepID=UPI0035C94FD2
MDEQPAVRTVFGRTLTILGAFADAPDAGLTLTQLANRTGLPMTTVHRLVGQLEAERVLERTTGSRYRVGLRLWELGLLAPRAQGLRRLALPILEDLYEVTHQNVQLMVLDGTDAVVVERLSARDAVRLEGRTGGRLPVHATSGGVVLLAHADPEVLKAVLAEPMQRFTPATITSEPQLRAAASLARRQGWIVLRDHLTPGSVSVAAPVIDDRRGVVAAVSVVADGADGDRLVPAVRAAARAIGRALRPSPA